MVDTDLKDELTLSTMKTITSYEVCAHICQQTEKCESWVFGYDPNSPYYLNCWLKKKGALGDKSKFVGLVSGAKGCPGKSFPPNYVGTTYYKKIMGKAFDGNCENPGIDLGGSGNNPGYCGSDAFCCKEGSTTCPKDLMVKSYRGFACIRYNTGVVLEGKAGSTKCSGSRGNNPAFCKPGGFCCDTESCPTQMWGQTISKYKNIYKCVNSQLTPQPWARSRCKGEDDDCCTKDKPCGVKEVCYSVFFHLHSKAFTTPCKRGGL